MPLTPTSRISLMARQQPEQVTDRSGVVPALELDMTVGIEGIAALITLLGALLGFWLSQRRLLALRRADLVMHAEERLSNDESAWTMFLDIDYDRLHPSFDHDGGWLGAEGEGALIRLLDQFNSISRHWHSGALRLADIQGTTLAYAIRRTARNMTVKRYLQDVDASDDLAEMEVNSAWPYFRLLAEELDRTAKQVPTV